jgi:hypothetical protein
MRPIIRRSSQPIKRQGYPQVVPTTVPPQTQINPDIVGQVTSSPNVPSRGLGDTVEKVARATGIDRVVKAVSNVTKKDCGCGKRKEALNKAFPYTKK